MKLYKFRSFDNIEFVKDIFVNERLFCAEYSTLNDPFEGLFSVIEYSDTITRKVVSSVIKSPIRNISGRKVKVYKTISTIHSLRHSKVCSLSSTMDDVRMWSLYADGHKGCVVEFDLEVKGDLVQVNYQEELQHFAERVTSETTALEILTFKTKHWSYEKEYRVVTEDSYFDVEGQITGVYFGLRTEDKHRNDILSILPESVPAFATRLDERNVKVIKAHQLR